MRRGIEQEGGRPARSHEADRCSRPRRCKARWAGPRTRSRRVRSHWPRRSERRALGGWNSDYALRDRTDEARMRSPASINPPLSWQVAEKTSWPRMNTDENGFEECKYFVFDPRSSAFIRGHYSQGVFSSLLETFPNYGVAGADVSTLRYR